MGQVLITEQYLSDIGSAIRAKAGTSEAFKPAQMASAIEAIPSGGSTEREDGLVARTLSEYENSTVTEIGNHAFYRYQSLTTISFSNVTSIGSYAFGYCSSLTTVSFPNVTSIESSAFYSCIALTTISFPNVTSIESAAFYNCYALTTVSFPNVRTIGNYAFASCSSLTTANFPVVTNIGSWTFYLCSSLTTASFSSITDIGSYAFRACYRLLSLYLLGSSIPTIISTTVFSSTPIADYRTYTSAYGSIYVPASLYSSYITATNWTTYSSRFVSV